MRLVEEKYRPIKKKLEEEIIASGVFEPKVVYGYFPAQGDGNDVIVYEPLIGSGRDPVRIRERTSALHLSAPARRPQALHLRFLRPEERRARWMSSGSRLVTIGAKASRRNPAALRSRRVHQVSLPARPERGDRRGAGRVSAQEDARRTGNRRRRFAAHPRPVPPEISRLALLVRISRVPESGGPDQAVRAAAIRKKMSACA